MARDSGSERAGAYNAWREGRAHPDDPLYEAIWAGHAKGRSASDVERRLERQRVVLRTLEDGADIHDIAGAVAFGATPDQARDHLTHSIAMLEEAIRCHGRNLSLNQARVEHLRAHH